MTIVKQSSGFTSMGFSKSGFSCCSHWHICNYGKNNCAMSDKDSEAAGFCNCYQRHHQIPLNKSSELDDLFSLVDDNEMDNIFKSFENLLYLQNRQKEIETIGDRVKKKNEQAFNRLSKMTNRAVLEEAVKSWVKMSASTNIIEGALKKGDKGKAFREFHRMVNESGSSGGNISYMKICDTIKITSIDGRLYNPTEKELWDIYYSLWEFENDFNLFNLDNF